MNLEIARNFFMWCSIMNYGLLVLWACLLVFAHDSYQRFNELMLRRKIEHFDNLIAVVAKR